VLDVRNDADIEPAFDQLQTWGADALSVTNLVPLNNTRSLIPTLVVRSRMPAISNARAWTEAGLLMSYIDAESERGRRTAPYVGRILRGADQAEMAIDQATEFELIVNRTTLTNLGLTIPPDVAAQVTEWVQ
jgi:putative tryptophan/tyrosine transport system substrate-binding protein